MPTNPRHVSSNLRRINPRIHKFLDGLGITGYCPRGLSLTPSRSHRIVVKLRVCKSSPWPVLWLHTFKQWWRLARKRSISEYWWTLSPLSVQTMLRGICWSIREFLTKVGSSRSQSWVLECGGLFSGVTHPRMITKIQFHTRTVFYYHRLLFKPGESDSVRFLFYRRGITGSAVTILNEHPPYLIVISFNSVEGTI